MTLDDAFRTLEESPISCLSLGSKELFHSNFLWWFAKTYPAQSGIVFGHYVQGASDQRTVVKAQREKGDIDLKLTFENGQELLIENKVKSLPDKKQLERYAEKFPVPNRLLLAFQEPSFMNELKPPWNFLSHSKLAHLLYSALPTIQNPYHLNILTDYIDFVRALTEFDKSTAINFETDHYEFPFSKDTQDLRLSDLYLKKKYENMAIRIRDQLVVAGVADSKVKLNISAEEKSVNVGDFAVKTGFSRAQGLVDVFFKFTGNIVLGVQLQAEQYRLIVGSMTDGGACKEVAERYRDLWFDFSQFGKSVQEYPKRNVFNKYGDRFLYRSVHVDKSYKVSQLIQFITKDALRAQGLSKSSPLA